MDWKIALSTFGLIFLAELGDKTQLAAIAMVARSRSPVAVFVGAVGALAAVTLIGVVFGETLSRLIPAQYIQKAAGLLFIVVGIVVLVARQ